MKYNKKYIKYSFLIASFFSLVLLSVFSSMCLSEEENELFSGFLGINSSLELLIALGIIFVLYEIIAFLICYLNWKLISYEVTEENIILQKGIIFKKKIVVPYEKIHTVSIERNLFIRFFKLSSLNIDSGNAKTSNVNEITIVLDKEETLRLEKKIKTKIAQSNGEIKHEEKEIDEVLVNNDENLIKDITNRKLLNELTYGSLGFRFIGIIFLIVDLFTIFAICVTNGFSLQTIFIGLFIYFVVFFSISRIVYWSYFIKYYNYNIVYNNNEIIIMYGLLNQHKHTLPREKIKGVCIKQDLVQIKRGFGAAFVEMVGLGVENSEDNEAENYLIPIASKENLLLVLKELGLMNEFVNVSNNVAKKSLIHFISIPAIIITMIIFPFIISFINNIVGLILFIIYIITIIILFIIKVIEKKNQGIEYDEEKLVFTNGIFVKKYYALPWSSIVSLGVFSTPWRIKKGIVSVDIDYYTHKGISKKKVYMLNQKKYAEILLFFEQIKNK